MPPLLPHQLLSCAASRGSSKWSLEVLVRYLAGAWLQLHQKHKNTEEKQPCFQVQKAEPVSVSCQHSDKSCTRSLLYFTALCGSFWSLSPCAECLDVPRHPAAPGPCRKGCSGFSSLQFMSISSQVFKLGLLCYLERKIHPPPPCLLRLLEWRQGPFMDMNFLWYFSVHFILLNAI